MMQTMTRGNESSAASGYVLVAFELSQRWWKVGLAPAIPAPINNLGPFSIAQNLSSRYKTGTAAKTLCAHASWLDADPGRPAGASRIAAKSSGTARVEARCPP